MTYTENNNNTRVVAYNAKDSIRSEYLNTKTSSEPQHDGIALAVKVRTYKRDHGLELFGSSHGDPLTLIILVCHTHYQP